MLWPYRNGDLSRFISWLTLTHTQRWHAYRQSVVRGQPFGPTEWVGTMIDRFGLASTARSEGRPKKLLVENGS